MDVAHDLGCIGIDGTGNLGLFNVLQDIDVIVGSFSKCFATNGGFIATNNSSISFAIRAFGASYTYSTAISPGQIAVTRKGLEIVKSFEGEKLRLKLLNNINYFKIRGKSVGLKFTEVNTPIIPIIVGKEEVARLANAISLRKGVIATVLEFPVVSAGKSRFRISMTPDHTCDQIDKSLVAIKESIDEAQQLFDEMLLVKER